MEYQSEFVESDLICKLFETLSGHVKEIKKLKRAEIAQKIKQAQEDINKLQKYNHTAFRPRKSSVRILDYRTLWMQSYSKEATN